MMMMMTNEHQFLISSFRPPPTLHIIHVIFISFEIEEKLLVLSENDKGWTKELNRVSFNGAPAKYDIRTWSPDHTKMGKGITLSNEEFQVLVDAFKN